MYDVICAWYNMIRHIMSKSKRLSRDLHLMLAMGEAEKLILVYEARAGCQLDCLEVQLTLSVCSSFAKMKRKRYGIGSSSKDIGF